MKPAPTEPNILSVQDARIFSREIAEAKNRDQNIGRRCILLKKRRSKLKTCQPRLEEQVAIY